MKQLFWHWPWQKPEPETVRPPKVGGTRAPDVVHKIDFKKPHDFHFRFGYQSDKLTVLERCVLVGFTTPMTDGQAGAGFEEYTHNRWLVLRQPDGRLVYVPRDSLIYIQESEPTQTPLSEGSDV